MECTVLSHWRHSVSSVGYWFLFLLSALSLHSMEPLLQLEEKLPIETNNWGIFRFQILTVESAPLTKKQQQTAASNRQVKMSSEYKGTETQEYSRR